MSGTGDINVQKLLEKSQWQSSSQGLFATTTLWWFSNLQTVQFYSQKKG
jgi:hypothetical protein